MDLSDFDANFDVGYSLTLEERAALEIQMAKRKLEEKLASIKFWGRVTGTTGDYLIACGLTSTLEKPHKKFYYASNRELQLHELPELTEDFQKLSGSISGRFLGNPTKLLGPDADQGDQEEVDEDGNPKPQPNRFSEVHRLSYVVQQIEHDTSVVPRGAFVVTPTRHIVRSGAFGGLSATEAGMLSQYYHFREAESTAKKNALLKSAVVGTGDFLDAICDDEPQGIWALNVNAGKAQATIRSFKWLGYFFWHNIETPQFGGVYFGDGQENVDFPFMYPSQH